MKHTATVIIRLSLIGLLGYAAISKLAGWQEFYHQINEISFFKGIGWWIAILVPTVELIIVGLLIAPKRRLLGLYSAFFIMLSFTVYIYVLRHFGNNIVCSCGGIISTLTAKQHFWFNMGFMVLAGIGVMLHSDTNKLKINQHIVGR